MALQHFVLHGFLDEVGISENPHGLIYVDFILFPL